jgi:hypothetical protein
VLRRLGCSNLVDDSYNDLFPNNDFNFSSKRSTKLKTRRLEFIEPKLIPAMPTSSLLTGAADVTSPMGLLEELFSRQPWQLLLATIFLNRTQRKQVDYILYKFLQRWPTPESVLEYAAGASTRITSNNSNDDGGSVCGENDASLEEMTTLVSPMGLTFRRVTGVVKFCKDYVSLLAIKEKASQNKTEIEPFTATSESSSCSTCPSAFSMTRDEVTRLFNCGDYAGTNRSKHCFCMNLCCLSNAKDFLDGLLRLAFCLVYAFVFYSNQYHLDRTNSLDGPADAYQIFIQADVISPLRSRDHALLAYVDWKRSTIIRSS